MKLKDKILILLHHSLIGLFLFVVFQSMGCSVFVLNHKTDEEFKPYIDEFSHIIKTSPFVNKIKHVSIIFSDLNPNQETQTLGVCYNMMRKDTFIKIDRPSWYKYGPLSQQALVFHELGHCICNIPHTTPNDSIIDKILDGILIKKREVIYLSDGCASSLMYPYAIGSRCLERHWNYYIKDLQEKCLIK